MHTIDSIYINGQFIKPHGSELFDLINPTNNQVIGQLTLGDEEDTCQAIACAKTAFATFSTSSLQERSELLHRLHRAVTARIDDLVDAAIEEYGAPVARAKLFIQYAADGFMHSQRQLATPLSGLSRLA
jgi:aldehyde dehydrogenase (NAD+)